MPWSRNHLTLGQSAWILAAAEVQQSSLSKNKWGDGGKNRGWEQKPVIEMKRVIKEKRKEQKLVKAHCVDLAGFKPRIEPPHPCFEEIR